MLDKIKNSRFVLFFKESYDEMMQHVTWSSYAELQESSILVLVASVIFALLIGVMDLGFRKALELFYGSF